MEGERAADSRCNMTKWKYRVVLVKGELSIQQLQEKLNELGNDGWEMAGNIQTPINIALVFKQPKPLILTPSTLAGASAPLVGPN